MKQYLDLLQNIMDNGCKKGDRTGTGTKSIFGTQMRFNLQEGFPLVTTKKIHFKSIVHELLWLLSGNTNIQYLKDNKVRIWDEWADENGDLGPVYGHQWRRWESFTKVGDRYNSKNPNLDHALYQSESIDQIKNVIERIKTNPECRRLIVTAWNPADLPDMALAPCHAFFQFNCRPISLRERVILLAESEDLTGLMAESEDLTGLKISSTNQEVEAALDRANIPKYFLDCRLDIRSSDLPIGGPYNIASYALLTHMIAQVTNTIAGNFVWHGGDTHCYINQFEGVRTQLEREPYPLPQIKLNPDIKDIDDFKFEDIELVNYECHPHIKMPVAV